MRRSFFDTETEAVARPAAPLGAARCSVCRLYKTCKSPKMEPTGKGKKGILVVAEAPGATEDAKGVQLIGDAGQLLRRHMRNVGLDLDRDCWKTNALICRPPGNATPTDEQIEWCRPNLFETISDLQPHTIILLGTVAVRSLVGYCWKGTEAIGGIGRWAGFKIPSQQPNAWICPTYHPSYLLRMVDKKGRTKNPALEVHFEKHLKAAAKLQSRPWDELPDYAAKVKIVEDDDAVQLLKKVRRRGGRVAFDYETNMLKPDGPDARLVSCAVCWEGKLTFAFSWSPRTRKAMSRLLRDESVLKIGANIKFEERWTRAVLGHPVAGWDWDTMTTAHALDNREGVKSVKFQSYVRLGQPDYDSHVKPYLESKGPRIKNRIHLVSRESLLKYNGMDALLEFLIAEQQRKEVA